jgi:hypothetical protein
MGGSISDIDKLVAQCYKHLKPGGWLELDEGDTIARSDDGSLTPQHSLSQWIEYLQEASKIAGKRLDIATTYKAAIEKAGFINVKDDIYKVRAAP